MDINFIMNNLDSILNIKEKNKLKKLGKGIFLYKKILFQLQKRTNKVIKNNNLIGGTSNNVYEKILDTINLKIDDNKITNKYTYNCGNNNNNHKKKYVDDETVNSVDIDDNDDETVNSVNDDDETVNNVDIDNKTINSVDIDDDNSIDVDEYNLSEEEIDKLRDDFLFLIRSIQLYLDLDLTIFENIYGGMSSDDVEISNQATEKNQKIMELYNLRTKVENEFNINTKEEYDKFMLKMEEIAEKFKEKLVLNQTDVLNFIKKKSRK